MVRKVGCRGVSGLAHRQRYVLVRPYGLDDREPATLAELREEFRVSRERLKQLQRQAEQMLKSRILTTGGARGDL